MPKAESRVTALLDVSLRTTESPDEEVAQSRLGPVEVVLRIHGAQNGVRRHAAVEARHDAREPPFTDGRVNVVIVHSSD